MPKQKRFTPEESRIFTKLNIKDDEMGLKSFIRGQREINGKLCQALWATIRAVEHQIDGADPSQKGRSLKQSLQHAKRLTLKIAGDPPGCTPKDPRT